MKQLSLPIILLTVFAVLLSACVSKAVQPTPVDTSASLPEGVIASARVEPTNWQDQSFSIAGQLEEVLVKEGEVVKAGQVLARLKASPEANLALARAQQELLASKQAVKALEDAAAQNLAQSKLSRITAKAALDSAQVRYDNDDSEENRVLLEQAEAQLQLAQDLEAQLIRDAGIDSAQMDALIARLASAEAALDSAQAAVNSADLKSTMKGTVINVLYQPGDKVTIGQPVLNVVDFSSWVVKTDNLTEVDVVDVQVGQKVDIVLDAFPGQTLAGEVSHINMLFEEKRGDVTYTVTSLIGNSDQKMRWGMTAAVRFIP